MTSVASTKSRPQRTARSSGLLVLEPPRHTHLPLAFLRPGKHLIGTSDACAIRVVAEGVQPRHAMLLVGDQMTLLKALDPRTWVNDGIVTETTLRPGDRISIGPITYQLRIATADELLESNAAEFETQAQESPVETVRSELPPQYRAPVPPPIPPELLAQSMRLAEVTSAAEFSIPSLIAPLVSAEVPNAVDSDASIVRGAAVTQGVATQEAVVEQPVVEPEPVAMDQPTDDAPRTLLHRLDSEQPSASSGFALRDIHRQIALLNEMPVALGHSREDARIQEDRQRLKAKEDELAQLAEELSRQAQRLRDRQAQLSEREAAHELKQSQLSQEQERLVSAAQTTRRELADEHAQQKTLWQEWDSAYRRTADELREQLEFAEQRRVTFQLEAERLTESRVELQRLRDDFERDRRLAAAERVQAAKELGELHSQRASFETERRQQLVEMQERESQFANERSTLALLQDELFSSQQKMEHDRTEFATERSVDAMQRELEVREHTQARIRLSDEETTLHSVRIELEADRRSFEQEHAILRRERDAFETARSEVEGLRTELSQVKIELDLHRQSLDDQNQAKAAVDEELRQVKSELDEVWRSRGLLESKLESERRQLQSERNDYEFERSDVNALRTELSQAQHELELHRASLRDQESKKVAAGEEMERLRTELEELRQSSALLRSQFDAERQSFATTREELTTALTVARNTKERQFGQSRHDSTGAATPPAGVYGLDSQPVSRHETSSFFAASSAFDELSGSAPMLPPPIPVEGSQATSAVAMSGMSTDDRGVGNSLASEESSRSPFGEMRDRNDDCDSTQILDGLPMLKSVLNPSSQTGVLDDVSAISSEWLLPHSSEDPVAERVLEAIDSTLSNVSHLMRTDAVSDDSIGNLGTFLEHGLADQANFDTSPSTSESDAESDAALPFLRDGGHDEDNSLPSLRAKLAQMFDLPENSPASDFGHDQSAADDQRLERVANDTPDLTSGLTLSTIADKLNRDQQSESMTSDEGTPQSALNSTATDSVEADESAEDNAWSRRLRELSQLVTTDSPAASPTAPAVERVDEAVPASKAAEEDADEYSVEAQLARLLGKPRRGAEPVVDSGTPIPPKEEPPQYAVILPIESAKSVDLDDRSHLMEEPRHRQNKNAIREEVQSFRAVAQMSARTALAKHTWDNLRNEFYMTSALTSASSVATIWFVGTFAYGIETEWWKGLACSLATLLSAQRLIRASKQLNQWRRKNLLRTSTTKAPAPPLSLLVEAAADEENAARNASGTATRSDSTT